MIALLLGALSPSPPPMPIPLNHKAVCRTHTSDGVAYDLDIVLRFERSYSRIGHWWTIDGDPAVFPSNKSYRNMYTYDDGGYDRSVAAFSIADQFYTYVLSFRVGTTDGEYSYNRVGNVQVYRRANTSDAATDSPIAIGFCEIETTKAAVE